MFGRGLQSKGGKKMARPGYVAVVMILILCTCVVPLLFSVTLRKRVIEDLGKKLLDESMIPLELRMIKHKPAAEPCIPTRVGGRESDGYGEWTACANWLTPESVIYSFGIGPDASFDVEAAEKYGSKVYCMDPTISSEDFERNVDMAKPADNWDKRHLLEFHQIGLGVKDEVVQFVQKGSKGSAVSVDVEGYTSNARDGQLLCIESLMEKFGHSYVDVLKVDVEGSEFDTFLVENTDWLNRMQPQQIMLEFHRRFFEDGAEREEKIVQNMYAHGYVASHRSGNGWEVLFSKQND